MYDQFPQKGEILKIPIAPKGVACSEIGPYIILGVSGVDAEASTCERHILVREKGRIRCVYL